ncbi:Solute carrier family 35 member G1 [Holothuria leucospilota]|uniref:Solute carrier family 35 member G1 n=1 Tax=Holothuria leucospilota TaxID=206669 RepID=A0A9Q1CLA2_HOLLE|nr:Solute carrier family 35 member G1 [Holothuria leucospilota]
MPNQKHGTDPSWASHLCRSIYSQRGILFAFVGGILWSVNGLAANIITKTVGVWVIGYFCSICQLLLIPFLQWDYAERYGVAEVSIIILSGLCDTIVLFLACYAYSLTTVGNTGALLYSKPLFCVILSRLVLQVKYSVYDVVILVCNLTGIALISKPPFLFASLTDDEIITEFYGSMVAIGAAVTGAFQFIAIRKLVERDACDRFLLLLVKGIIGFFLCSMVLATNLSHGGHIKSIYDLLWLTLQCGSGLCSCLFVYAALQSQDASTVALVSTVEVLASFLLQVAFTDDSVDWMDIVGAFMITICPVWYAVKGILCEYFDSN